MYLPAPAGRWSTRRLILDSSSSIFQLPGIGPGEGRGDHEPLMGATTQPPPTRLSARQVVRRQAIVDAALALLEGRDYDHIQVKDVADHASVALGTVYHYFSSKEQLFGEALVQWAATLGPSVLRRPLPGRSQAEQLEHALHRSVAAFERRPQLAKLVARLEVSGDPAAAEVLQRLDATTNQVYLGVLRDMEPAAAVRVVRVLDAVLDSSLRAWSAGRLSVREVRQALSDAIELLFGGGSGRPGRPSEGRGRDLGP